MLYSAELELLKDSFSYGIPIFMYFLVPKVFFQSMIAGVFLQRIFLYKGFDFDYYSSDSSKPLYAVMKYDLYKKQIQNQEVNDFNCGLIATTLAVLGAAISSNMTGSAFIIPVLGLVTGEIISRLGEEFTSFMAYP